jgi:hypothetical protein
MGFKGYKFRVFRETQIRVGVSSQTSVEIWIPKIDLLEGLVGGGAVPTTYPTYIIT